MRKRAEKYWDKADEAEAMAACFVNPEARRDLHVIAAIYRRIAEDIDRHTMTWAGQSYQSD